MANRFVRFAFPGGDIGNWDLFEEQVNQLGLGNCTAYLYDDAGTLKLGKGRIGLDDGSQQGALVVDTVLSLSIAALTPSEWARVEVYRTYASLNVVLTSIAGESNPSTLPSSFVGSYDGDKQGYYLTGQRRTIGVVWISSGGSLGTVINCYTGTSYDEFDTFVSRTAAFTSGVDAENEVNAITTVAASFNGTVPAATGWAGKRRTYRKIDTGAGVCTIVPAAGTLGVTGATAFPLRKQGDYLVLESDGTDIHVVGSLSTLDSAAIAAAVVVNTAHGIGVVPRHHDPYYLCLIGDQGWAAGEVTKPYAGGGTRRYTVGKNTTNITIAMEAAPLVINNKGTGVPAVSAASSWAMRYLLRI